MEFEDALKAVRQEREEEQQANMDSGQQDLEGDEELAMGQARVFHLITVCWEIFATRRILDILWKIDYE